jgi:hypothetical protein
MARGRVLGECAGVKFDSGWSAQGYVQHGNGGIAESGVAVGSALRKKPKYR